MNSDSDIKCAPYQRVGWIDRLDASTAAGPDAKWMKWMDRSESSVKPMNPMSRRQRIASALVAQGLALTIAPAAFAAGGGGLVLIPDTTTVIVLLVGFLALIPLVSNVIVKPVYAVLDERQQKMAGARKRAEALELSANEVLARYEGSVREVREESEQLRRGQLDAARAEQAQITQQARSEAEGEIEQSQAELRRSLEAARAGLRTTAENLARQAAERILGRTLS